MEHRLISPIELYSVARHQLDYYRCITFYLRFHLRSTKFSLDQWKDSIQRAVRLTIDSQPRLTLQVDLVSSKEPHFILLSKEMLEQLPVSFVQRSIDDENEQFLMETLEKECNTRFNYDRCSFLWRVIVLFGVESDNFDLIVSFNHAIADGISGMAFLTTFADHLAERATMNFSLNNDLPSHQLIPSHLPPMSSLISAILEKLLLPRFLSQYFFPKTYWTGKIRPISSPSTHTRLVSITLSKSIVDSLHKHCQREQTTINSAILAAVLLSIMMISEENLPMEFFCNTAVNIRRFCHPPISNQQMGVFVSAADSHHYIPLKDDLSELFWPLSRQIKEQVHEQINHSALPLIQSMKFISNWNDFLVEQRQTLPNGYQHSVDISNLLSWTFENTNPLWQITHGGFTQSLNTVGSVLTVSLVTVNGVGKIILSFEEKSLENIRDCLTNLITRMSSNS